MIRFCLVGAGFIGPVHAANIAAHPRAQLAAVVDLNEAAASVIAERFGGSVRSWGEALADPSIDAVLIATPPRTHAALIEAAARAGKAIFCEKPIDLDLEKVAACRSLLLETGVPFFVGFNRRFDPTHAALADRIRGDEIGRLEMLILSSRDPEISPPDYVAQMPYGIFYDTMIHDFDMARWLTGEEPIEVYARVATMLSADANPCRDPDTAMVILTMANGALVHVNSSFRSVYGYDQRVEAFGAGGMLISRNQQPLSIEQHTSSGSWQVPLHHFFIERYRDSYVLELDHFVSSLEGRRRFSIEFEDGRIALLTAYAAMESAKRGKPQQILAHPT